MSKISKDNDLTSFFTIKDVSFYIISLYRSHSLELCLWISKEPLNPGLDGTCCPLLFVLFLADGDMCNHGCQQCKYQTVLGVLLIVHHSNKYSKY